MYLVSGSTIFNENRGDLEKNIEILRKINQCIF